MNTLPYDLSSRSRLEQRSIERKKFGISRIGSSSDVMLEYLSNIWIGTRQGRSHHTSGRLSEPAAAFRTGKIAAFPAPPGVFILQRHAAARFSEYRGISKALSLPLHLRHDDRNLLGEQPAQVKRLVMALTEGVHFFKRAKKRAKKFWQIFST